MRTLCLLAGLWLLAAPASATPITYTVFDRVADGSKTVSGTVTTNGTLGVLQQTDFLAYTFVIADTSTSYHETLTFSSANPTEFWVDLSISGTSVYATAEDWYWLAQDGDRLQALAGIHNPNYSWELSGAGSAGSTLPAGHRVMTAVGQPCCVFETQGAFRLGTVMPDAVTAAVVPEPSTLVLVGLGLAGARIRARNKRTTSARP